MAYYRMAKKDFEASVQASSMATQPEPCEHCAVCNWWPKCNQEWREQDHLGFVAGISKSQRIELGEQGVSTLTALAESEKPLQSHPKRGAVESYAKVHHQAKVQLRGSRSGKPEFDFVKEETDRGFQLLPEPDAGDVFFDIEGKTGIGGNSLEYLFGHVTLQAGQPVYQHLWALDGTAERQMFEQFIDFLHNHWQQHPNFHIFHFAPYEPSALRRLVNKHATRQDQTASLLRAGKFVDLYAVTRQAVRAGVESYSIKQLEQFYDFRRQVELDCASKSLRELEKYIELEFTILITEQHRKVVQLYNEDDCRSTHRLREWLEQLREQQVNEGIELPRKVDADPNASEKQRERSQQVEEVFNLLTTDIIDGLPQNECQHSRWLFAHMLDYFRRESHVKWFELIRLTELTHEDLLMEHRALTGLNFVDVMTPRRGNTLPVHRYRYSSQESIIKEGDILYNTARKRSGTVVAIDDVQLTIDIKKTRELENEHPASVFEFKDYQTTELEQSLLRFGRQLAAERGGLNDARSDMLRSCLPRLKTITLPPLGDDTFDKALKVTLDLDESYLAIQGPPGAGKTTIGSRLILELVRQGKRVGVTAVGHQVILNLLENVAKRANEAGTNVRVAHQADADRELPAGIERLANRNASLAALKDGAVVGGTAWLWSHPESNKIVDYLFVDEAGQMSLAMALAAGQAAKNIILLGDPQQLDQPQQAHHPHGCGQAALTHILAGAETIPDEKGLFLPKTWRLHPDICRFTSEQYYNSRLRTDEKCQIQEISGDSDFVGSGLILQTVEHSGNLNSSQEEVSVVQSIVEQLLNGKHQWAQYVNGVPTLQTLSLVDILVVAPFNAQVHALRESLPEAALVGTVDKFQGKEAPVVIYSMTSSSAEDAPRGISFLYSRNRLNVATSRAKCLVILVCSPSILTLYCKTPDQMRLANGLCRFRELARV